MLIFVSRKTLRRFVNDELNAQLGETGATAIDSAVSKILHKASIAVKSDGRRVIKKEDIDRIVEQLTN